MERQRVKDFYENFRFKNTFAVNEETDELLKNVFQFFSHHRSKADQEIAFACAQALDNNNPANRKQIITSLIKKLPELIKQIEQKEAKMEAQFAAFRDNKLF
ncbi:MAG: hypothetical protein LBH96_01745 [Candidatus Peribacteria bacterium]|jgi:hypothetical protein|nr:hypothetical protein [Candidatus Peribacteria bacterium]